MVGGREGVVMVVALAYFGLGLVMLFVRRVVMVRVGGRVDVGAAGGSRMRWGDVGRLGCEEWEEGEIGGEVEGVVACAEAEGVVEGM